MDRYTHPRKPLGAEGVKPIPLLGLKKSVFRFTCALRWQVRVTVVKQSPGWPTANSGYDFRTL